MLLSIHVLARRYLPDVPRDVDDEVSDGPAATALTGILGALEQAAATWLLYPAAPADPEDGDIVPATWSSRGYVLYPRVVAGQLVLPINPVTAIESVHISESADWQDDGTLPDDAEEIAVTDFRKERTPGGVYLHPRSSGNLGRWPTGRDQVRVVCVAGYEDEAALPAGVADALYRAAADTYTRTRVRTTSSSSQGGSSQSFLDLVALPPDVELLLLPHRLTAGLGAA